MAGGGVRGRKEAEGGGKNQEWKGTEGDGSFVKILCVKDSLNLI